MKMEERGQHWQGQGGRDQQEMWHTLATEERNCPFERSLGLLVPVADVLVFPEFIVDVALNVSAADREEALQDSVGVQLAEPEPSQRLDDARRATWLRLAREEGMEHL